jgi:hypothetical protein
MADATGILDVFEEEGMLLDARNPKGVAHGPTGNHQPIPWQAEFLLVRTLHHGGTPTADGLPFNVN